MSQFNRVRSGKIIFLDIDGVLNSMPWIRTHDRSGDLAAHLDPRAVRILSDLVRVSGAEIVVSSSWRIIVPLPQLAAWLRKRGFSGRVIGLTPTDVPPPAGSFSPRRGAQIARWLSLHGKPVDGYVVLDDEVSDMDAVRSHVVRTDRDVGLTAADANRALSILRTPWKHPSRLRRARQRERRLLVDT